MTPDERGLATRTCPVCRSEVATGTRFCSRCGATLAGEGATLEGQGVAPAGDETASGSPDVTRAIDAAGDQTAVSSSQSTTVTTSIPTRETPASNRDRRPCPSCGAPNSSQRELCGRCGADLETGIVPPRPERRPLPATPSISASPRRRRWWIPVVAIVGVVAAIVATFWLAELGPFASEPTVPVATFEAQRYEGDPDTVALSDIATATTSAPEGDRSFTAAQMVDADPTTAWHSDSESLPEGQSEKIDLFLAEPAWVDQIVINNGDHSDSDVYAATARILRAQMTLDGGRAFEINLLDQGRQAQYIELPDPELTTTVRIEVLETVAGDDRPDIAVSDLELRGWVADESDADLAEERADVRRAAGPIVVSD